MHSTKHLFAIKALEPSGQQHVTLNPTQVVVRDGSYICFYLRLYYILNASKYEVQTVHIEVYLLGTTLVLIATACLHKTYYLCYT